jgi:hypothetical protein
MMPAGCRRRTADVDDEGQVGLHSRPRAAIRSSELRTAAEVHDDLDECVAVGQGVDGVHDLGRQGAEQGVEVVDRLSGALR